jgi:hypothetical protein
VLNAADRFREGVLKRVFEHQGEEYIVTYSGGNLFANAPRGDSVWLFP